MIKIMDPKAKRQTVFLLVDGNAIIHRAFHALPPTLTDGHGHPTNAVFGFARIFLASLGRFEPQYVAVALDMPGPTFRDKLFEEYKAKRVKAPQELYDQIPSVKKLLDALEVPWFGVEGFEADDVIGTLAHRIVREMLQTDVVIVTGDNDALQLVNHRVKVAMPQKGAQEPMIMSAAAVEGKFGIKPSQIVDFKALRGDASDNIPGVRGIGEKTAVMLLQQFGTVSNLYRNLDKVDSEPVRKKLADSAEESQLSLELAKIKTDVPLDFKLSRARVHDYDRAAAEKFLHSLNMKSLIARLPESHRKQGDQTSLF